MSAAEDFTLRVVTSPRLQYKIVLAVALPILILLAFVGALTASDFLQGLAGVVIGPVVLHRFTRSMPGLWRPQTIEGKIDYLVWRLPLEEVKGSEASGRIFKTCSCGLRIEFSVGLEARI